MASSILISSARWQRLISESGWWSSGVFSGSAVLNLITNISLHIYIGEGGRGGEKKEKPSFQSCLPFSFEKSGKSLRCLWGWKLSIEENRRDFFYVDIFRLCLWDNERTRRLFWFSEHVINRGVGNGVRGGDKEGKEPGLPWFCSPGARCVEALPVPRPVVKTFYEQTMSVYWNHMITEMGSFIVFRLKSVCIPLPSPGSRLKPSAPGPDPPTQL